MRRGDATPGAAPWYVDRRARRELRRQRTINWVQFAINALILFALFSLLLQAGCAAPLPPASPAPPPSTPWVPVDPESPPTPPPSADAPAFDQVESGMTKTQVVALLGTPHDDPAENPGEVDQVHWRVTKDGELWGVWAYFEGGRLRLPLDWKPVVDTP